MYHLFPKMPHMKHIHILKLLMNQHVQSDFLFDKV
ncbi:hypothetical protein [Enterocloster phage PMBT24]|uniref:Uncharacterized protein n=1 Tax=Enterocloster phage PMBT24 TaxID=3025413 RepID=A0AAT9TSV1_9CAUD|nr:hypothetical protein [Enterocloster phage PMBT24]